MAPSSRPPGLGYERACWDAGGDCVVGIDEVGRGSWAGPLTLAAVVLPRTRRLNGIRDSKQLTAASRERLFPRIIDWCEDWAVGHASPAECDELGMSQAQRLAVARALGQLKAQPDSALVDGNWDFVGGGPSGLTTTRTIVKGDQHSLSIAAASIVAKVTRDRMMIRYDEEFGAFNFASNKGYPCPRHKIALQGYGPTSIHRRSWSFMDDLVWTGLHR